MIYLSDFTMPSPEQEKGFLGEYETVKKISRNGGAALYPFRCFEYRKFGEFTFSDITVFCGNNGSGKSTILNVIAEKLGLKRSTLYNRTDFFGDYVKLARYTTENAISQDSRIITSDDVFDRVLEIRRLNAGIDDRRSKTLDEYMDSRINGDMNLHSLDDYKRWQSTVEAKTGSATKYLRSRIIRNAEERSNGESALSYFVDSIADGALYLLDEPENSLSPENQLELKYFLEDCVHSHGCQFVISTHSPFLLSLRYARIYDIEQAPPRVSRWTELEAVRVYHDFFEEKRDEFN